MKWIRFTLETHTDAVDILSYMLDEIGVEGIEIEDHIPLTEEEKRQMYVDILPDPEENDGSAKVHFYMEPEKCNPDMSLCRCRIFFKRSKVTRISERGQSVCRKRRTRTGSITGRHFSNHSAQPTMS